jgi:glycosyltransferase involved in cell wall biosynthesis
VQTSSTKAKRGFRNARADAPRHEVAIYSPAGGTYYDGRLRRSGGGEWQMILLGRGLAAHHRRVAHIVHRHSDPLASPDPDLTLVHRALYSGDRPLIGPVLEGIRAWRALWSADGRIVIVSDQSPVTALAALFARVRRRRYVYASMNNSNFTSEQRSNRVYTALYRLGLRLADVIVVQSQDQIALAKKALPSLRRVVRIPSFVEIPPSPTGPSDPAAFLWIGRVVSYKQPLSYVELARAVPEARFTMVAVRQGRSVQPLEELRAAVRQVPNLELLDPLPHAELMDLVERSVAVVNTSTTEGMPNVFLEAWARGVPVLSLEFDPDRVIAERRLGVVAGGSFELLVAGARELWEARHDRQDAAERARGYVEEVHSAEAVTERWVELIDHLSASAR